MALHDDIIGLAGEGKSVDEIMDALHCSRAIVMHCMNCSAKTRATVHDVWTSDRIKKWTMYTKIITAAFAKGVPMPQEYIEKRRNGYAKIYEGFDDDGFDYGDGDACTGSVYNA